MISTSRLQVGLTLRELRRRSRRSRVAHLWRRTRIPTTTTTALPRQLLVKRLRTGLQTTSSVLRVAMVLPPLASPTFRRCCQNRAAHSFLTHKVRQISLLDASNSHPVSPQHQQLTTSPKQKSTTSAVNRQTLNPRNHRNTLLPCQRLHLHITRISTRF